MDLTIKHKPRKANGNADALSRNPYGVGQVGLVETEGNEEDCLSDLAVVHKKQLEDPKLGLMVRYLTDGTLPLNQGVARRVVLESKQFSLLDGVLHFEDRMHSGRLCVVVPESLCEELLKETHGGRFAGHFSEKKIYDRLRRYVWWVGMKADVRRYCRRCLTCATRKGTRKTFNPLLQPIPVGGPFHHVGVDVLQLPTTVDGNCYVVVFIDYLTKWPEAFAVPNQEAETIARLFIDHVVCRHGAPQELLSDRGANFLSSLMQEVCRLLGVKKINTSGYHPQTDSLVEKFNSTLINKIAKTAETQPADWDTQLPCLLFAYHATIQESTKESPFFLLYGHDPRIPMSTILSQPQSPYVVDRDDYQTELMLNMRQSWELARDRIQQAQQCQKPQYDWHASEVELRPGHRAMVYMPAEEKGKHQKLAWPFHGPYRVLIVTPTNIEVQLIDNPTDKPIFVS